MLRRVRPRLLPVALVLLVVVLLEGAHRNTREDLIWQHRNLGKAFYENPTTQKQAVDEFRKALELNPGSARERLNYGLALLKAGESERGAAELVAVQRQDPRLPHTWFNLGVYYKIRQQYREAIQQFQGLLRLVPNEPVSHYNLGVLYRQNGNLPAAVSEFETAARLDPALAAPRFQLYSAYRTLQRPPDSERVLAEFRTIKEKQDQPDAPKEDVNWSVYAEIYDPVSARPATPAPTPEPHFRIRDLPGSADPKTAGILLLDFDGDGKPDALIWSASGILLYRSGTELVDRGLSALRPVLSVAAGDYDNDGLADLCIVTPQGALLFHNAGPRGFERKPLPASGSGFRTAIWVDYDHDRDLDLLLFGDRNLLLRNDGPAGWEDRTRDFPFAAGAGIRARLTRSDPDDTKSFDLLVTYPNRTVLYRDHLDGYVGQALSPANSAATPVSADFLGRGRLDRIQVAANGHVQYATRETPPRAWLTVALTGVKSPKIPTGAQVEVSSGSFYQRQQYDTIPLTFDLGDREVIDTIRIVWPNGLIQNETHQLANRRLAVKEAPRLSGSCPMIFTWNGNGFVFATDVLGVAPLGASSGDGSYFPVDHDEYVSIPGGSLVPRQGRYDLRITEELNEVTYLDQVRLMALDHPAGTEVFTNEKWKGPPYPEFRLFGINRRVYPIAARDNQGRDVLPALLHRDQHYVDGFSRDVAGVAAPHSLYLDFGPAAARTNRAVLILTGWVDWADGSTFLKAAQEHRPLVSPSLQIKDASGRWQTAIEDMGMPSGKTKTIAVDLTGRFLS
ncbi:MAG: VCBS repeat-containing protein, partial [Acidobacteriia bacterium]|nr:VCBS repeat-containing protein [Terriglobia bacterium]